MGDDLHVVRLVLVMQLVTRDAGTNELQDRIDNLRLLPLARHTTSPLVPQVSGRTFIIEPNDDNVSTIRLDFSDGRLNFRLADHRGEHLVRVGLRDWIEGSSGDPRATPAVIASTASCFGNTTEYWPNAPTA